MKEAYAWLQNRLVGRFFEGSDGATRFEYAPEASMLISLSLPLDDFWQVDAPGAFLDGLLPDNDSEREAMRLWFGAASADPLDLLVATDTTGGLCFTSVPEPGEIASLAREFAREKDIAIKVYRLGRGWTTWQSDDRRSRFALAGSQGEFALERFDGRWTWPNAKHPSTHIVKPPHDRFCGVSLVEDATMHLAAACGLDVARSFVRWFGEDQAYVVERFDREVCADGQVRRIHVEDFTQALGVSRHAKYSVTAADAFALLKRQPNGRSLVREWAKQLVFNTLVGNCDAHGKNYSLYLRPDGSAELRPLYDALCTRVWQETSRSAGDADQFQEPGKRAVPVRLGSGSGGVGDLRRRPRWSGGSHSRANRNARARRSGEIPRLDTGSNDHGDRRQQPAAVPGAGTTA